ncbi:MAG: hypothetical protein E2598_04635 [Sphingobium sp.]|nr:hypothetical protein [Sphingobium sp.]
MSVSGPVSGFSGRAKLLRALGATLAIALVASSATPAMAQRWGNGGYNGSGWSQGWGGSGWRGDRYRPYRHRDRGLNAGDVVGIAALIGAVAVIASSASKNSNKNKTTATSRDSYPDYPYNPQGQYDYPANGSSYPSAPYPSGSA